MFKIKFDLKQKEQIKQALGIQEGEPYSVVLCSKSEDMEEGKINLVFTMDSLDEIKKQIQFFSAVKTIQLHGKTDEGEITLSLKEITHIESYGNDIYAYTEDDREVLLPNKLYQLVEDLEPFGFVRIGKSCIVNVGQIYAVKPHFNGKLTLTLTNKKVLEVNRTYVKPFKQFLDK